jgi:5S rRNA maturation endonuclease (ribonuclease M5)
MADTVGRMSKEELKELIQLAVETALDNKLLEILSDPDEGLEIRKTLRKRLLGQQQAVAAGERGRPLEEVVQQLGLE